MKSIHPRASYNSAPPYSENQETKLLAGVPLVIITGLSGAGKSVAMRFLEDLGCFCVDNLPPALIPTFFSLCEQSQIQGAGVVIASDVRSGALFEDFAETIHTLEEEGVNFEILFFECDKEIIMRRFAEVRRTHPLQQSGRSMEQAIEEESRRLVPIREIATRVIDTSTSGLEAFREILMRNLVGRDVLKAVTIHVMSFGFKHGMPRDMDFVFDVRFLRNPFYEDSLKAKSGEDREVYDFVMSEPLSEAFFAKVTELVDMTLDAFIEKGKTTISIGVGCTGGRHRSVAMAKRIYAHFTNKGIVSVLSHRDVAKSQQ